MSRAGLAALWFCFAAALPAAASGSGEIKVGSLELTKCVARYDGYCGSIVRFLDPDGRIPGKITIGFEFYPRSGAGRERRGVIIAQEGGPGYSTTDSRDGYVRLLTPLRDRGRDILLIDKRGTGRSGAIDCHHVQKGGGLDAVRACGRKLGDTSWLYSSTFAADDVAAVLAALDIGKVDYYGDSYGTFFGEVLAARHPDLLRTVVLDSAYPVTGDGPYFQSEIENGPVAFAIACARTPACSALGGDAQERFRALVESLREKPVSGRAPGAWGDMKNVTADPGALFTIVANAGNNFTAYRDIDAAGRAWLENQDPLPLLRLVAEATDGEDSAGPPSAFSTGLELAVECADYTQLYDMRDSENDRHMEFKASLATTESNDPHIYAPFQLDEAVHAPANPEGLNLCQAWPDAPHWARPGRPVARDSKFPAVPVLVLSGELDTVTSPKEGRWTAALFPNATFLEVPNTVHETAIGNGGVHVPPFGGDLARCTGPVVLSFVESGGLAPDTSCFAHIRPVRAVSAFAADWESVAPAVAQKGNEAGPQQLTLASAVAETVGDAVARYGVLLGNTDRGLRGGTFVLSHTPTGYTFNLRAMKWTDDLAVSGTIDWNQITGHIVAKVSLSATGHAGHVRMVWDDRQTDAEVSIDGKIDGQTVTASRIAP
jgi:pimeloyl-ACP methyl ester carboxylesterase